MPQRLLVVLTFLSAYLLMSFCRFAEPMGGAIAPQDNGSAGDQLVPKSESWFSWLPKARTSQIPTALRVVEATRASDEWSLRVERDGIRVWRRDVRGSPHEEIRGNGLINASPRQVFALLRRPIGPSNPSAGGGNFGQIS